MVSHLHPWNRLAVVAAVLAVFLSITASSQPLPQAGSVWVDPGSGPPGTTITISGSGFHSTSPGTVYWEDQTILGSFDTNGNGYFSTQVVIPNGATSGDHPLTACSRPNQILLPICGSASFRVELPPTPTLRPTNTPLPTPTPTEVPTVCDPTGAPGEIVIDFESFNENEDLTGVTLPEGVHFIGDNGLDVIRPGVETHSGSQALRIGYWVEFGSALEPIRIGFSALQDFVGVFVGLSDGSFAHAPITATLTAYALNESGDRVVAGSDSLTFGPELTPIKECLSVTAPRIYEITLDYASSGEPETMDDLVLRGPLEPVLVPVDDRPPVVNITSPGEDQEITGLTFDLQGDISEDRLLDNRLEVSINYGDPVELFASGAPPAYVFRMPDIQTTQLTPYQPNFISVAANDMAGNRGYDIVSFRYNPPPTPTPTPTLDLIADSVEITQVIQCLHNPICPDNSVPLYMGKPTLVRLYVRAEGAVGEIPAITGELCYDYQGLQSPAPRDCIPSLNAITVSTTADPVRDFRGDITRTLNFIIPVQWTTNENIALWFNARVNPDGRDIPECCLENNSLSLYKSFRKGNELNIVAMRAEVFGERIREDQIIEGLKWILRYYPTSDIDVYFHDWDPINAPFNFTDMNRGWLNLLERLDWIRFWTYEGFSKPRYHAFVPPWIDTGGINGMAWTGKHRVLARSSESAWGRRDGSGDTAGHELMHNHGFAHAPGGCSEEGLNNDYPQYTSPYPLPDGSVQQYPRVSIGEWGVDLWGTQITLLDPNTTSDIMSYCDQRWMSLYSYLKLADEIDSYGMGQPGGGGGLANIVRESGQEYLVGGGYISATTLELDPSVMYRVPLPDDEQPTPDGGRYRVELRDSQGTVLFAQAFSPSSNSDDPDPMEGYFFLVVPWQEGTASIAFMYEGSLLGVQTVSSHAPQVQLLEPNGGENWPEHGQADVRWEASDEDGDTLRAIVQYSPDTGQVWEIIGFDITETDLQVDVNTLRGGARALLRVCVSDGVNTACDESDGTFSVPSKPPQAFILSPAEASVFPTGQQVILQGYGIDKEDGAIPDGTAYVWASDRDGQLGTGRGLWGLPLSNGRHELTLTVTDSDGNQGATSVSITVGAPTESEPTQEVPVIRWKFYLLLAVLVAAAIFCMGLIALILLKMKRS